LTWTAPQSGELKDPFARLGHGAGGSFLEGLADQLAIGGHFAFRVIDLPSPKSLQPLLPERDHVALNRGPTHADDLGGLLACEPTV
jgi:hypothetical protein